MDSPEQRKLCSPAGSPSRPTKEGHVELHEDKRSASAHIQQQADEAGKLAREHRAPRASRWRNRAAPLTIRHNSAQKPCAMVACSTPQNIQETTRLVHYAAGIVQIILATGRQFNTMRPACVGHSARMTCTVGRQVARIMRLQVPDVFEQELSARFLLLTLFGRSAVQSRAKPVLPKDAPPHPSIRRRIAPRGTRDIAPATQDACFLDFAATLVRTGCPLDPKSTTVI